MLVVCVVVFSLGIEATQRPLEDIDALAASEEKADEAAMTTLQNASREHS